eukprot:TRINITY_DN18579_c0_g1_i1.p1 TRINITY_DN18579_c0_g1~~TRINITY_DN18579_c0_g1_i1.p1  ORF type:complete len:974 (+),score=259.96 TRINITY_DN18579_c0_g1_i1:50-2923(+)
MLEEAPQFSEFKPAVLDPAVRKNPAKWKQRNERRRSRKAEVLRRSTPQDESGPTWEVKQLVQGDRSDNVGEDLKTNLKVGFLADEEAKDLEQLQKLSLQELRSRLSELGVKEPSGTLDRSALEVLTAKAMAKDRRRRQANEEAKSRGAVHPQRWDEAPPPSHETEDERSQELPKGRTMPGGYYVRSPEELHMHVQRSFNARMTKPYVRPARPKKPEEEDIPPLEPAEEETTTFAHGPKSQAAMHAAERVKARARSRDQFKSRQQSAEEQAVRRKQAELLEKRRQVEAKVRQLKEENEAKETARRAAEEERQRLEKQAAEAKRRAAKRAKQADTPSLSAVEAKEAEEKAEQERLLRAQRRAQKDAEEDARLRELRQQRKLEAARQEEERKQREEEEKRRLEEAAKRQAEEKQRQEELQKKEEEERRRQEEVKEADQAASLEKEARQGEDLQKQSLPVPTASCPADTTPSAGSTSIEELRQAREAERAERKKQAELRRKEAQEKAAQARKAATQADGAPCAAASAAAAGSGDKSEVTMQISVALLGPQGSGKTMLVGAILLASGALNERDLAKRRREIPDTEELQREEGIRTPGGAALTLLDVPGGRRSLPQAVQAAAEADVAVLVVSAKGRELEAAMKETGGGTSVLQEQLRVCGGLGVRRLVVAVTKMEEANWAQDRFERAQDSLRPALEQAGFKRDQLAFVPVDGLNSDVDGKKASWHEGGSLLECLDWAAGAAEPRAGPPRVLLFESLKDASKGGLLSVRGRVEQGRVAKGLRCLLAPHQVPCIVEGQMAGLAPHNKAEVESGEVVLQLSGGPWPDLANAASANAASWCGTVLADAEAPINSANLLKASLDVLEMPRPLTVGFRCMLHIHTSTVEAEIEKIHDATDLSTGIVTEKPKMVKAGQRLTLFLKLSREVPVEVASAEAEGSRSRLSLLMLRSEETTIGIGHVLDLPKST